MGKKLTGRLNLLTVKQIQAACEGDHTDGGGLLLRVRGSASSWVFRFTAPSGRRREMGLGMAHRGSAARAGDALTGARKQAHEAREQLQQGVDPIDARERRREAAKQAEVAKKAVKEREHWTLARCARDYHARVIEPTRTDKHGAQWIASLENHIPRAVWDKPVEKIEPPELLQALHSIKPHDRARNSTGDRPNETVQRVRQRLDAVFEDAIFHKRCASNSAAAIRRKLRESMPRKQGGQFAALPYGDAPAFAARLRGHEGLAARCLELAMLTAARTGEALLAQWREFDLDAAVWTVPATKMKGGEEHVVYPFRLNSVVLGLDEDGEEIVSCVVEHAAGTASVRGRAKNKLGPLQKQVLAAITEMSGVSGQPVPRDDVFGVVKRDMDAGVGRDTRSQRFEEAVNSLVQREFVIRDGVGLRLCTQESAP